MTHSILNLIFVNARVEVVSTGKLFVTMLPHASFLLIWNATWPYSEELNFGLCSTPMSNQGADPGLQTKILLDMFQYLLHLCLHIKIGRNSAILVLEN